MKLTTPAFIDEFRLLEPRRLTPQSETLDWLAHAHALATENANEESVARLSARLARYGAGPEAIDTRGLWPEDFHHRDWSAMSLFRLDQGRRGIPGMEARTREFSTIALGALERFYAETPESESPSDLIHVTCTGYSSPSAAQRLVAAKGWQAHTLVTHCYHMGCYASLPAIRMAASFLALGRARADVVHTELCSLHAHPELDDPGQLVVESLFADGFARYSVTTRPAPGAFRILAVHEEILPGTEGAMQWLCSDQGMKMVLAQDVPLVLAKRLRGFVTELERQAGVLLDGAVHAIHPGGPKVIEQVGRALGLAEERLAWSRAVLKRRGNMSSATLPHIWSAIAADPAVAAGTPVVSLAFGPGLTVCGAVFLKCGDADREVAR